MQTIVINTTTQSSGLSYAWDRDWDIKTAAEARWKYEEVLGKIARYNGVQDEATSMEKVAELDGYTLRKHHKLNRDRVRNGTPLPDGTRDPQFDTTELWALNKVGLARRRYSKLTCQLRHLGNLLETKAYMEGLAKKDGFPLVLPNSRKKK